MSTTLILVLVVTFAFAMGRAATSRLSRYVTLSGAEYLLVGLLVGPLMPWKILSEERLTYLQPLVQLLTGLLGFVMGVEGRRAFRESGHALVGFGAAFVVAAGTALLMLPLLVWLGPSLGADSVFVIDKTLLHAGTWSLDLYVPSKLLWAALIIGCSGASCSSYAIDSARRIFRSTGPVGDLLVSAARAAQIGSVFLLGLALASARASEAQARLHLTLTEWEFAAVVAGIVCGLLFGLFLGREQEQSRTFLATIGLVTFAAGLGSAVGISPIFVNLIAGLTVSFSSPHSKVLHQHLQKLLHPLYVLLMLFAGALWLPLPAHLWILVPVFIFARLALRRLGMNMFASAFLQNPPATRLLGSGMWAPGTLAVAIAVSGSLRFPDLAPTLMSVVLVGTLLSELFSHRALRRLLDDAGEISHSSEFPPEIPTSAEYSEGVQS